MIEWQPMRSAPKDGRWIIACCWDGITIHRVSWGRDRQGKMRWCSADRSFGDLFGGWIPAPERGPDYKTLAEELRPDAETMSKPMTI